jgi:hypothetical protein
VDSFYGNTPLFPINKGIVVQLNQAILSMACTKTGSAGF